jgi:hypothetical protein
VPSFNLCVFVHFAGDSRCIGSYQTHGVRIRRGVRYDPNVEHRRPFDEHLLLSKEGSGRVREGRPGVS